VDLLALAPVALLFRSYFRGLIVMSILVLALFAAGGLYRPRLHLSLLDDLPRLLGRLLIATALISTIIAIRHDRIAIDGFLRASAALIAMSLLGRALTTWTIRAVRRRGGVTHRTVLVGGGPLAADVARVLARHPQYGLRVVGYVDAVARNCPADVVLPCLGDLSNLRDVLEQSSANSLIVVDPVLSDTVLTEVLRDAMDAAQDIFVVPRMHLFHTQTGLPDHIGAIPVMRISPPVLTGWQRMLKRTIDITLSLLAMVILAPVFLLCAVGVRLEGGPGFLFRQERVGRNGQLFQILKFRSLRPANDGESDTKWSVARDDRMGRFGRMLRRTSLDEIPQLYNILRGDMTLVGPRPERPFFVEQFSSEYRDYGWRHRVPAGLTGLAQVSGLRGDTPIADRARFDNYYIENWSLWLDLKIVLRTLREVVSAGGR
jgi:exopolysaccharide biosynthesis polyprenyl glycosylphosphotransferase